MKKFMILAGAITILNACNDEKTFTPDGYPSVRFGSMPSTLNATPAAQSVEIEVTQTALLGYAENSQAITLTITAEWNPTVVDNDGKVVPDAKTNAVKPKVAATIKGSDGAEKPISSDGKTEVSVSIPAGEAKAKFVVTARCTEVLRSKEEAKLNIAIAAATGPPLSYDGRATITIKGNSPLQSAPTFAMLQGRTRVDTLWFGVDKGYFSTQTLSNYVVEYSKNSTTTYGNAENVVELIWQDSIPKGKLAVKLGNPQTAWAVDDTIRVRVRTNVLPEHGILDTIESKFVVAADKLKEVRKHDFAYPSDYFALLGNNALNASQAQNAKASDLVFYIDTTTTRTDSTYVLKMMGSMDSSAISVEASTEAAWNAELRTQSGAQEVTYSDSVATLTLPTTEHIDITGYGYYAVKICAWKAMEAKVIGADGKPEKDANGKDKIRRWKERVTYYGYLRLRTHMVGSTGSYHGFNRVEFSLKYGEKRDYTKE